MASGLRVHIPRPPKYLTERGIIIPLIQRNPERLPPPELAGEEPTPLELPAERPPIVIDPNPNGSRNRVAWSISQLVQYLATVLWRKVTGRLDDQTHAVLTRQLFERMSGLWIKVGQLLSLRNDLMSAAMTRELSSLHYQAHGFPPETARAVIEADLGRPINTVFAWFEDTPFAAATIAQVHRATLLRNNRAVVVKVMRPDVARSFARDLRLLELVVGVTKTLGIAKQLRLTDALVEMRTIFTEETNFQFEAVNLKRMRKNLKKHDVYVPRLIERLSSSRVLVMEEVPGVLMSQYISMRRVDPERVSRWAILNGIDEKTLASRLCVTALRQVLEENEFHGDLHPGNIMLLADNRIALIDFGSVGRLTQRVWTLYRLSLEALATRDYNRAADLMLMLSPSIAGANTQALRRDMALALHDWELEAEFPSSTYGDRSIAGMSAKVSKVMTEYKVPPSWAIMRVGRTLSTLDASLQTLAPDADFMWLCRAYFVDYQRRAQSLAGRRQTFRKVMRQVSSLARDLDLLIGSGIRNEGLRINGMLDTLTNIRLMLITFLYRGLLLLVIVMCEVLALQHYYTYVPAERRIHFLPSADAERDIVQSVPTLHPFYWVLIIVGTLYLVRLLRDITRSITRSD